MVVMIFRAIVVCEPQILGHEEEAVFFMEHQAELAHGCLEGNCH